MVTNQTVTLLALSYEGVQQAPHFEKISFRVRSKIFATLDEDKMRATLKLSLVDQSVFADMLQGYVYPVPNKWGQKGWTIFDLASISEDVLKDALTLAYCEAAPKKFSEKYRLLE